MSVFLSPSLLVIEDDELATCSVDGGCRPQTRINSWNDDDSIASSWSSVRGTRGIGWPSSVHTITQLPDHFMWYTLTSSSSWTHSDWSLQKDKYSDIISDSNVFNRLYAGQHCKLHA